MTNNMIQIGVAAIRAPDGRVIKDAPLYASETPETVRATEDTFKEFARVAARRMHEAMIRERRARRKQANA